MLISRSRFSVASRFRRRHSRALNRFFSNLRSFFSLSCSPSLFVRLVRFTPAELLFCSVRLLSELLTGAGGTEDEDEAVTGTTGALSNGAPAVLLLAVLTVLILLLS